MTIREMRALTGLSQDKFAERYEIPASTLRKWEQGTRNPPAYVVNMLETIIKTSLK